MKDKQLSQYIRAVPQYLQTGAEVNGLQNSQNIFDEQRGEIQLRRYFEVFFKYRYIILACIVGCAMLSLIYSFLATPEFTAESKIKISTYEPVLSAAKMEDVLQQKSRESSYLETQVQEISSLSLADKVLENNDIREFVFKADRKKGFFSGLFGTQKDEHPSKSFVSAYKHSLFQLKQYLQLITVSPIRRTSLVAITATTKMPELSANIANKHAQAYIDWIRSTRVDQQSTGLKFLKGQAEELKGKVADLEREMAEYAEENSIVAVNKDENIVVQRMAQLNKLQTDVSAERIEADNLYKEADRALSSSSAGFDDSSTQSMRSKLAELESEYGNLSAKFLPSYPKMQQIKAQIENLKQSIQDQRKQIVLGLKAKWLAALEKEKNVKEELDQQKSRAFELSKKQVQYNILNRELDSSRELLQNVIRQIKETSLAAESNSSNVTIVDYALVPRDASFPNKRKFLLLGLILGVILGVSVACLLGYIDNTFRTPEQVSGLLQLPALGVVPAFEVQDGLLSSAKQLISGRATAADPVEEDAESLENDPDSSRLVTLYNESESALIYLDQPQSLAAEAYRTIRTGILLSQAGKAPKTLLVTSAQSSEGKTTSVCNLAATLASTGGNVVIIDADLRRPSVHKYFNLDRNLPGTVEILTGQKAVEDVLLREVIPRVSVITSGRIPPNPAELLGSKQMQELVGILAENFDYVVVDSPPVLPVTDTVLLSQFVEGVVLVVKAGATPRKVVRDAKLRLQNAGANVIGTILNNVNITGGDYYYYNRYYYSYYSEEPGKIKSRAA